MPQSADRTSLSFPRFADLVDRAHRVHKVFLLSGVEGLLVVELMCVKEVKSFWYRVLWSPGVFLFLAGQPFRLICEGHFATSEHTYRGGSFYLPSVIPF